MSKKVNIYSAEWCEMVFTGRNQDYGAYVLRKLSGRRHLMAIIIGVSLFSLAISLPTIISSIIKAEKEKVTDVTALSNLKMDAPKEKKDQPIVNDEPPPVLKSSIKFVPPVIAPDDQVSEEDEIKSQEELNKTDVAISVADVKGSNDADAVDIADLNKNQGIAEPVVEEKPFTVVEQNPEFPGGVEEMMKFIQSNVKYPQMAREAGIQGKVFLTFVVGKDGRISKIQILRGIGGGCDEEAIRIVKSMPDWKPGKQSGQSVPVQFNLPIVFKLQ